jgi:hypothetical protein
VRIRYQETHYEQNFNTILESKEPINGVMQVVKNIVGEIQKVNFVFAYHISMALVGNHVYAIARLDFAE